MSVNLLASRIHSTNDRGSSKVTATVSESMRSVIPAGLVTEEAHFGEGAVSHW